MSDISLSKKTPAKKPPAKKPATSTPFKSLDDIKLGMIVKDPATGLVGVAAYRCEMLSGSLQYAIQPQGDGETVKDAHYVDDFMLEFVSEGVSKRVPSPDPDAKFRLGVELKDTVSGFQGIAIERTTYLNGCVHYSLQPSTKAKAVAATLLGEPPRAMHYDHKRLKEVGPGVAEKLPKKVKPAAEEKVFKRSSTGGPTRSASYASQRA